MAHEQGQTSRDRHLFGPGPKRVLALDGGGTRGIIAIAFLQKLEDVISEHEGRRVLLCDYFDLIGGTSTGAILATGLALGFTATELYDIYEGLAPKIFARSFRVPLVQAKFGVKGLRAELERIVGDRTLDSPDLKTGLCVVAKRMDTGSPWIVANNSRAPYWNTPDNRHFIGNRHYRLANLVRASTAAPTYFDPERLPIVDGHEDGLFVDGGVSPHNNPSMALFLMTQWKGYGLCWPTGPDVLTVVSIGTGTYRKRMGFGVADRFQTLGMAVRSLKTLIDDSESHALALMQWLGKCRAPWPVNSEVGTLCEDFPAGGPLFRFLRYDIKMEEDWLKNELDIVLDKNDLKYVREMDQARMMPLAYKLARMAAARQVEAQDWAATAVPPVS